MSEDPTPDFPPPDPRSALRDRRDANNARLREIFGRKSEPRAENPFAHVTALQGLQHIYRGDKTPIEDRLVALKVAVRYEAPTYKAIVKPPVVTDVDAKYLAQIATLKRQIYEVMAIAREAKSRCAHYELGLDPDAYAKYGR